MRDWLDRLKRWMRPWEKGSEPIEIHRAVLDEIESRVVSLGSGRRLFPYDHLQLVLRVRDDDERLVLKRVVAEGWDLENEIRERLTGLGCEIPSPLTLEYRFVHPEDDEEDDPRFAHGRFYIVYGQEERSAATHTGRPSLLLEVLKGNATEEEYVFTTASRIQLGRLREVLDQEGHFQRRNHIAFEDEGEVNATVSRQHATIDYNAERQAFFLRDDNSVGGTRIFRNGRSILVGNHRGGVRLRDGDEVALGHALLAIRILEGH